jgi:hypothetical protein
MSLPSYHTYQVCFCHWGLYKSLNKSSIRMWAVENGLWLDLLCWECNCSDWNWDTWAFLHNKSSVYHMV